MSDWQHDLDWSAKAFSSLVWPVLQKRIGGELIHVEQMTAKVLAKDLDQLAGIDAWHIMRDKSTMRGIASRVQICSPNFSTFDTFTIRKSRDNSIYQTEYQKRKMALISNKGYLYPHLTVQSYISDKIENGGYLRTFAVGKTKTIIGCIDNGDCQIKRTKNAEFYVIAWSKKNCEYIFYPKSSNARTKRR